MTNAAIQKMQPQVDKVSDAPLREFVGYHIKRAFNVIQTDLNDVLARFDLRMISYSALVLIVENPGIRQSQLASALAIERPNLVVIIDELEKRELIARDRLLSDRRAYLLQATLAGRRLCDKAAAAVGAHEEALFDGIDKNTRSSIVEALNQIEAKSLEDRS